MGAEFGISPNPLDGEAFADGIVGEPYVDILHVLTPSSTDDIPDLGIDLPPLPVDSLTVNSVDGALFSLNIIPHTQDVTTIQDWKPGTPVNLEVDIIARYLERLLLGERAARPGSEGVSMSFLAEHGFLK